MKFRFNSNATGNRLKKTSKTSYCHSGENNRIMFQIWMPDYFLTNDEDDAKFREYIKENIDTIRFDKSSALDKKSFN